MAHARCKFNDVHVRTPTAEERLAVRQDKSLPLMVPLNEWRQKQNKTLSSISGLKEAYRYLNNHWNVLNTFCHNGWAEIDNNIAENALRLAALGRTICSLAQPVAVRMPH